VIVEADARTIRFALEPPNDVAVDRRIVSIPPAYPTKVQGVRAARSRYGPG
jgi:hypothetical protein